jgi:hypothetical protein
MKGAVEMSSTSPTSAYETDKLLDDSETNLAPGRERAASFIYVDQNGQATKVTDAKATNTQDYGLGVGMLGSLWAHPVSALSTLLAGKGRNPYRVIFLILGIGWTIYGLVCIYNGYSTLNSKPLEGPFMLGLGICLFVIGLVVSTVLIRKIRGQKHVSFVDI